VQESGPTIHGCQAQDQNQTTGRLGSVREELVRVSEAPLQAWGPARRRIPVEGDVHFVSRQHPDRFIILIASTLFCMLVVESVGQAHTIKQR
jgi:hypothetical protein